MQHDYPVEEHTPQAADTEDEILANFGCDVEHCPNQTNAHVINSHEMRMKLCPDCYERFGKKHFEFLSTTTSTVGLIDKDDEIFPNLICDVEKCPNQNYSHVIRSFTMGINFCPDCYEFYFDPNFDSTMPSTAISHRNHVGIRPMKS